MQNAELLRFQFCILHSTFCILGLVRKGGLEPPRPLGHWILSPARLPIPPLSRDTKKGPFAGPQKVGAPTRTRTWNQQIKSLLLYQLSYGGRTRCNEPPRANILARRRILRALARAVKPRRRSLLRASACHAAGSPTPNTASRSTRSGTSAPRTKAATARTRSRRSSSPA